MSNPCYIHVQTNGEIWFGCSADAAPTSGTNAAIFKVNSSAAFQKIGTLSGSVGSYAATGNGRNGKELV
jgi:hypothetical protein